MILRRRIKEKCDELDALKKTYQKSIESMQASLENETRAKGEAIRQKKKLEADINEMEIALDHANKAHAEAKKAIKRTANQVGGYNNHNYFAAEFLDSTGLQIC